MEFNQKKAIVFDLDGTLLNTLQDLKDSLNAALKQNGLPERTTEEVRQFVGNGLGNLIARAIPDGRQNPLYHTVLEDMRLIYAQNANRTTCPYDGIPALIDALLARGYRLAVVSNKPDEQVKSLCQLYFPSIPITVGQRADVRLKPAPDSVLEAIRQLGCSVEDAVYIGDSEVDVQTAQNAHIPCISVLWGFRDQSQLLAAGADRFAETPAEMPGLLESFFVY